MQRSCTFPRSHRLRSPEAFAAAFGARVRSSAGPLTLYALPNQLDHPRLGISIGRKAGVAVRRNRIKRLLRESYRQSRHDLPAYDLVIVVRPHEPLGLRQYHDLLRNLVRRVKAKWDARGGPTAPPGI